MFGVQRLAVLVGSTALYVATNVVVSYTHHVNFKHQHHQSQEHPDAPQESRVLHWEYLLKHLDEVPLKSPPVKQLTL